MGGYRVTPKTETFIINAWKELHKKGLNPTAKQVLSAAEAHIKANNIKDIFLPKLRKIQNIIRDAKKNLEGLPESEQKQQGLWSMATLDKLELSPESIPYVLQVWRYSVNLDAEFTIRQAKWVSRLYPIIRDIPLLWFWSRNYANDEETAKIIGQQMDTFIPDTVLFMGRWETHTLLYTGYREGKWPRTRYGQMLFMTKNGHIVEELLHGIEHIGIQLQNDKENSRDYELSELIQKLPSLDSIGFTQEAKRVYLRWFTYLIKGPKWNSLSAQEALSIIKDLRNWVLEQQKREASPNLSFIKTYPTPDDILRKVGHTTSKGD